MMLRNTKRFLIIVIFLWSQMFTCISCVVSTVILHTLYICTITVLPVQCQHSPVITAQFAL